MTTVEGLDVLGEPRVARERRLIFGKPFNNRFRWAFLIGIPVAGALGWSIFSSPGPFYFYDSTNHFYLIQKYHDDGSLLHYTVNSPGTGSFYPIYAMYGGTLYALTALLGSFVGSDWLAYGLTYFLAFVVACAGVVWLARMFGLQTHHALAVGIVYVTSSYYLSNAYGRGAWTEFIATSAYPVVLAAVVSVVRSARPSRRSVAILIVATVVWSGSHMISLVYGTLFALTFGVIVAVGNCRHSDWPRLRSAVLASTAAATGFALNGWFLVPQMFYARSTRISTEVSTIQYTSLTHLPTLLAPIPAVSPISTTPHLYTNLPMLPLVWALSVLFVSRARQSTGRLTRLTTAFLLVTLLFLCWHRAWVAVPRVLYMIQFPYRLLIYATLLVCALAALAVKALSTLKDRSKRRWMLAGAAIVVCQVGLAAYQIQQSRDTLSLGSAEVAKMNQDGVPPSFFGTTDYRLVPDRPIERTNSSTYATTLTADGTALVKGVPPWSRVVVDIPDSPFVKVNGATRAGATADGLLVLDTAGVSSEITLANAVPRPAKIGRWVTSVGALSAVLLIACCRRPRRLR